MKKGRNCKIYQNAVIFDRVILGDNVIVFPGAVIGRPSVNTKATARIISSSGPKTTRIGDNCVIGANAVIYDGVDIGSNTMVCDNACVRSGCRIGAYTLLAMGVTVNCDTRIGSHVKIMDNTHVTGNVVVEDHVFIGPLVSTTNDNSMGRLKMAINDMRGPRIKKFATIGAASAILPNVVIGENAFICAQSLVNRDIPARVLAGGAPARVMRKLARHEINK
jgi:acetyltransferase-like isoleucine patch superfamily enzyme